MMVLFESGCSGCFAGLSCGARYAIIQLLQKKSSKGRLASGQKGMSVTEIAKHFKVTQPTITHHLQYLKSAGILKSKKEGRMVYYAIDPKCGWDKCEVFNS